MSALPPRAEIARFRAAAIRPPQRVIGRRYKSVSPQVRVAGSGPGFHAGATGGSRGPHAQEGPQGGWRLDCATEPSLRIGVVEQSPPCRPESPLFHRHDHDRRPREIYHLRIQGSFPVGRPLILPRSQFQAQGSFITRARMRPPQKAKKGGQGAFFRRNCPISGRSGPRNLLLPSLHAGVPHDLLKDVDLPALFHRHDHVVGLIYHLRIQLFPGRQTPAQKPVPSSLQTAVLLLEISVDPANGAASPAWQWSFRPIEI